MSSAKRHYNETISSNSSNSASLNDNNVVVEENQQEVEHEMDIEEQISNQPDSFKNKQVEEENSSRRKRLNTTLSHLNNYSSSSSMPISYANAVSNTPNSISPFSRNDTSFSTTYNPFSDNYISPSEPFNNNNNNNNNSSKSTVLKETENTKAQSPIDLLMSSPPISTSTPKQTNQIRNTSNSSLTLTTQSSETWDFNYPDSYSSNSNYKNTNFIRTRLTPDASKGPFSPVYSEIYDTEGIVYDSESFNYLIQLYEFCDNNSTKLQSNITSTIGGLLLLLNNQLEGFEIPLIEHHKWNGSHFYGPIDVVDLLDQLDDGLGLSSAEYVFFNHNGIMRPTGSVLQCGYRRTSRKDKFQSSSPSASSGFSESSSGRSNNNLQNNDLRHAVLDRDAEKEAKNFLELLAEEEENEEENEDDDNGTEQEEESDSFTEISKESDDDDDSFIQGFASTSIQQRIDTFGNPINQIKTTSIRRISRPSANNDGNETDNSLDDYVADSGNLSESTFEEIDFSDIESIATESTVDDGWHHVSRDDN